MLRISKAHQRPIKLFRHSFINDNFSELNRNIFLNMFITAGKLKLSRQMRIRGLNPYLRRISLRPFYNNRRLIASSRFFQVIYMQFLINLQTINTRCKIIVSNILSLHSFYSFSHLIFFFLSLSNQLLSLSLYKLILCNLIHIQLLTLYNLLVNSKSFLEVFFLKFLLYS